MAPEGSVRQASRLVTEVVVSAIQDGRLEELLYKEVQLVEVGSDRQA